jgi:hypothetical protein
MVASIVSVGGCSSAKSARKAATLAAKEAAKAVDDEAAEAASRQLGRRLIDNAKTAAENLQKAYRYLSRKSAEIKKKVKDKVVQPIIDKALGLAGLDGKAAKPAGFMEGVLPTKTEMAKEIGKEMWAIRNHAKSARVVRATTLARNCTKAGFAIEKAALE